DDVLGRDVHVGVHGRGEGSRIRVGGAEASIVLSRGSRASRRHDSTHVGPHDPPVGSGRGSRARESELAQGDVLSGVVLDGGDEPLAPTRGGSTRGGNVINRTTSVVFPVGGTTFRARHGRGLRRGGGAVLVSRGSEGRRAHDGDNRDRQQQLA